VPLDCPIEISHIWGYFKEMSRMRARNGMCISPLSQEIVTWQALSQVTLNPFELDVIWRLDAIYIEVCSTKD
jgi:hypothetical protein